MTEWCQSFQMWKTLPMAQIGITSSIGTATAVTVTPFSSFSETALALSPYKLAYSPSYMMYWPMKAITLSSLK